MHRCDHTPNTRQHDSSKPQRHPPRKSTPRAAAPSPPWPSSPEPLAGAQAQTGAQSGVQTGAPAAASATPEIYKSIPAFDTTSIDTGVDPCTDFYKFACGRFAANHPIPADQGGVDQFYALYNVNTQSLRNILEKSEQAGTAPRSSEEAKIGDFYYACMDQPAIDREGLTPIQPPPHPDRRPRQQPLRQAGSRPARR